MPADQWLAAQIRNEPDLLSGLVNARVQGDVVWRQEIGLRRWRVAFVGAGFVDHPSRGVIPVQTVISNFMDHGTGAWLSKPADWAMYILAMPPERRAHVKYAGAEIPATQLTAMAATIEEKALGNPSYAADVLTGAIRQVATRNKTVSEGVLVSCIPRHAYENANRVIGIGRPNLTERTFFTRVPGSLTDIHYSPTVIPSPGVTMTGNVIQNCPGMRFLRPFKPAA